MSDWGLTDLTAWDDKICAIAKKHGLDWYPITYETCDYFFVILDGYKDRIRLDSTHFASVARLLNFFRRKINKSQGKRDNHD